MGGGGGRGVARFGVGQRINHSDQLPFCYFRLQPIKICSVASLFCQTFIKTRIYVYETLCPQQM